MPAGPICRAPAGVVIDAARVDMRVDTREPTKGVRADDVYLRNSVEWSDLTTAVVQRVWPRESVTTSSLAPVLSPLGLHEARLSDSVRCLSSGGQIAASGFDV